MAEVQACVAAAMASEWANPHAQYRAAQKVNVRIQEARAVIGAMVGAPPASVLFTSGATEANAWALTGHGRAGRILTSAIEHPSVLAHATDTLPVHPDGVVRLDVLEAELATKTVALVSIMGANNETGVLQPITEIARLCGFFGAPFHCDATQMPGRVPLDDLARADLVTLSGHKMGGPRGIGALVARIPMAPWLAGGPQERGLRAGTVNAPGVFGFATAAEHATPMPSGERDRLEDAVRALGGDIIGANAPRLPNTCCALFDIPGDLVVMALDLRGFAVSTGSACASGAHKPSTVISAMGRTGTPVRFSLGRDSNVSLLISALSDVLGDLRSAF